MKPRTIEVAKDIWIGEDDHGFYMSVESECAFSVTRPEFEKLRNAILKLLEEEK